MSKNRDKNETLNEEYRQKTVELTKLNHELRKLEDLFNESQRISNLGAWEVDLKSGKTFWTKQVYEIHEVPQGFDHNLVNGIEFYHPEDRSIISEALNHTLETGEPFNVECRFITAKGNLRWVRSTGRKSVNSDGASSLVGAFQDITDSKIQRDEIENFFKVNLDLLCIADLDGNFIKTNEAWEEVLGYSTSELNKRKFLDFIHPDDMESTLEAMKNLGNGQIIMNFVNRYRSKDGSYRWIEWRSRPKENLIYAAARDITDRLQEKQKLAMVLAKNQAILDASTQVSIIAIDFNGNIISFNKGAENQLGYSESEVLGKSVKELLLFEEEIKKNNIELTGNSNETISDFENLIEYVKSGNTILREWTLKRKDESSFPVILSITPIKQDDEPFGILGVGIDISDLKKAEKDIKRLLELSQDQNDRLKNFAHIVSHNLRSHASGILGMLEILKMEEPELYSNEYVQYLKKGANNLQKTIQHLTEVVKSSYLDEDELKIIPLKPVVERNIDSLITTAEKNKIQLLNLVNDEIYIRAIPAYLDSIIMNFITNSIKYADKNKNSYLKITAWKTENNTVVQFTDNGLGIDMDKFGGQLFELYKTFHNHSESSGIGLHITKNQIQAMGGTVEVESAPGIGTTFRVVLRN